MPRRASELSALAVSRLKEPGMHFVGGVPGLALQVLPTGARTWLLRIVIGTRRRDMGLGGYPGVSLAEAREAARVARKKVKEGVDPIDEARAARSALRAKQAAALTFEQCAAKYIKTHSVGWRNPKHVQQWTNTLTTYAYPVMGNLLVRDIQVAHVLAVLEPIWTDKTETASRIRGRIESVLDWATTRGYRQGLNPARWRSHLDKLLPARSRVARVEHYGALPVAASPAFMSKLREAPGMGARALEFAILGGLRRRVRQ